MRRIMMMSLCVLAVCATAGVAAASASAALPEYLECGKVKGKVGGFINNLCTEKSETKTGAFELLPLTKAKKVSVSGKNSTLESTAGIVTCGTAAAKGSITNSKEWTAVVIRYTKCTLLGNGQQCTNQPVTSKKAIVTNALKGSIGYLAGKGGTPTIGLSLKPETGEFLVQFTCGGPEIRVKGTVIGVQAGNVNVVTVNSTLTYKQSKTVQEWTSFEGGKVGEETLKSEAKTSEKGAWEPAGGATSGYAVGGTEKTSGVTEIKA
jgi:hypothetical protein